MLANTTPEVTRLYGEDAGRYLVIVEGSRAPTVQHESRYAAAKEARRLARKYPETRVHLVKLKESLVFEQDIVLNDRVTITDRDSPFRSQTGIISTIDPNGCYGVRFISANQDDTTFGAFRRDQFKVVPKPTPEQIARLGARIWFKDGDGEPLTATIESVNIDRKFVIATMDVAPVGPQVVVPFALLQTIEPAAFTVGDYVKVVSRHHRYPASTGYVSRTDDFTVFARLVTVGGGFSDEIRFVPSSLIVLPVDRAFGTGDHVQVADGEYDNANRVGVVTGREGDHVLVRFDSDGPSTRYSSRFLRPASSGYYAVDRQFDAAFWLGEEAA